MRQHQEDVKNSKRGRGNGKEIDGHEFFGMVLEEGFPGLRAGRAAVFGTIFADSGIGDVDVELGQFGLNPSAAPSGIGLPHPLNQRNEFTIDGGSSADPGFPAPEEAKANTMPTNDGLGLEEEQDVSPVWPKAHQTNPKQPVSGAEFRFARLSYEHGELMSERQIFKHEPGTGLEAGEEGAQKRENEIEHGGTSFGGRG